MRRYVSGSRDRGGRGKASAPSVWYQLTCSAGKQRSAVGKGKISFLDMASLQDSGPTTSTAAGPYRRRRLQKAMQCHKRAKSCVLTERVNQLKIAGRWETLRRSSLKRLAAMAR